MLPEKSKIPNPFEEILDRLDRLEALVINLKSNPVQQEHQKKSYLNVKEASEFIGLSVQSVYRMSSQGKIPCLRKHKKLLFIPDELISWLNSGRKIEIQN